MSHAKDTERVLFELRRSRKAYFIEYLCAGILFFIFVFGASRGLDYDAFDILLLSLAVFAVCYAEISRVMRRYLIHPSKMTIIDGIIRQHRKHVYFHPLGFVPDINVHQDWLQRILGYGTISMKGSVESFEIKDIENPHAVMEKIEHRIRENKSDNLQKE